MLLAPFEISWLAITCNLEGADVYLGLAAGMDDVLAHAIKADQMVAFPFQQIRLTTADDDNMPLRVYAVRDPAIVSVVPLSGDPPMEGFHRVRLDFRLRGWSSTDRSAPTAAEAKAPGGVAQPPPQAPVMAFLLTIGLLPEREDQFYRTVVKDFLARSWMTMPRLLKQIGCLTPSELASGAGTPCAP